MRILREKFVRFVTHTVVNSSITLIALMGMAQQALGQVTPASGGSGTEVTLTEINNTTNIDITGGQQSSDGANLFHNFEQFDIDAGQSARFITPPDIQNVLSTITGGPSTINGLLQVLGSQADLYLINPAGILFGPDAQLNLPGSLSATTATGIGFDDQWLSLLEPPPQSGDYSRFVGRPTAFDFSGGTIDSGAVINLGDLALGAGQFLTLMGETVVNTGDITVPGGTITLTAVEGNQLVRLLGQGDQLLSLEVSPTSVAQRDEFAGVARVVAPTLGELLTGGSIESVDTLVENADGTVSLVNTGTVIPEQGGTAVVSGQLSTDSETGGEINIFGSQVAVFESTLSVAGSQGGGTLRLGGDMQGSDRAPTARQTYVGRQVVLNADAIQQGDGGQIYIWSDEATAFYGSLSARGGYQGGNGGFAEISGKLGLVYDGAVDLTAAQGDLGTLLFDPRNITIKSGNGVNLPSTPSLPNVLTTFGNLTVDFVLYEETLEALGTTSPANIVLQAINNVVIEDLADNVLSLTPGTSLRIQADFDELSRGSFLMDVGDTIRAPGGTVNISAGYNNNHQLIAGNIDTSPTLGQTDGGDIILSSRNRIQAGLLNAGNNGKIELNGESIDLLGGVNSIRGQSITLQPVLSGSDIIIGDQGDTSGGLHISVDDIAALHDSLSVINIGRSDGTGQVTLLADVANGTGNGFVSPTRIQGEGITLAGSNLDTVWKIDWSPDSDPVNSISTHDNVLFYNVAGIVGGSGHDTIEFLDYRSRLSSLIDGGAGDLALLGDDLFLPTDVQGSGHLFVNGLSPNVAIELGETFDPGGVNTLNLLNGELSSLFDAPFESITIGDESTGLITVRDDLVADSAFTLRSGDRIDTTAGDLVTVGQSPLTLIAEGDVTTGHVGAAGGDISVTSTDGNITMTSIDASGESAGGDIAISAANGTVQVTGYNDNDVVNPSVVTSGDGTIRITHGGDGVVPFTVGRASTNGTVGAITTQADTVSQDELFNSFSLGDISILTQDLEEMLPVEDMASLLPGALQDAFHIHDDRRADSSRLTVLAPNLEAKTSQEVFSQIEAAASAQFEKFLSMGDRNLSTQVATLRQVQDTLSAAEKNLDIKPVLLYVYFVADAATPDNVDSDPDRPDAFLQQGNPTDQLEVMLISGEGDPIRRRQWGVTRAEVEAVARSLRYEATSQFSRPQDYLPPAQQLYRWIIQPLEEDLHELKANNLAFIMDDGLRTLPLSMLHDGEAFLVEQYSLGLMPTFSLTDLVTASADQVERADSQVLAMGASRFSAQPPLPAVEAELSLVSQSLWQGESFLNERFTLDNLKSELGRDRYNILHLATHAVFNSGDWDSSYIQLWDERVTLNALGELGLKNSDIGLIILSACNTALGDRNSEYGFAGFAVNAGSESALASLWPVSDEGTLGFMTQFYQQLSAGSLRSESLRQAQIAMLRGEVMIANGQVKGSDGEVLAAIPELAESGNWDFSHPFYWSAFTMIGNPW